MSPVVRAVENERLVVDEEPHSREQLRTISIGELLSLDIPERPKLLAPVLPEKGLAMIYASRGIGKTFLGLAIAYAVASGGRLFRWSAPSPRRVVYVDGEMPLHVLQERLRAVVLGIEAEAPPENFQLLPADAFTDGLPHLAFPVGQTAIEPLLEGASLVVLDNISTLASTARDNEAESWSTMQEWLLRLRRQGYSVLLIHHAGKSGNQRGTSRREDVLDTSILLKRPEDYVVTEGARFEIHFEKARGLVGDDIAPFEVKMEIRSDGGMQWTTRDIDASKRTRALELLDQGMTVREVAAELGMSKSSVDRIKQAAAVRGAE